MSAAAIAATAPTAAIATEPTVPVGTNTTTQVAIDDAPTIGTQESVDSAAADVDSAQASVDAAQQEQTAAKAASDEATQAATTNQAATKASEGKVESGTKAVQDDSASKAEAAAVDSESKAAAEKSAEEAAKAADAKAAKADADAKSAQEEAEKADASAPAQSAVNAAEKTASDAKDVADADQKAADAAKQAADTDQKALEAAEKKASDAQASMAAADKAVADATQEDADAKVARDDAQAALEASMNDNDKGLKTELEAAQRKAENQAANVEAAKSKLQDAAKKAEAAQKAYDAAAATLADKKADADTKAQAVTNAQQAVGAAQKAYDDAQEAASKVDTKVLQASIDEAQKAYDALPSGEGITALKFLNRYFDYTGLRDKAVNDGTYNLNDSTVNFDSLLKGCDVMDAVNAQRKQNGRSELDVSAGAVAYETLEADINDSYGQWEHSDYDRNDRVCLARYYTPAGAVDAWVGENDEYNRALEEAMAQGMSEDDAYEYADQHVNKGHYLAVMSETLKTQGASYGKYDAAWGGNYKADKYKDDLVTPVAEWRKLILAARDGDATQQAAKKAALDALNAAKKALSDGQELTASVAAKKAALETAQDNLGKAQVAKTAAEKAVAEAQGKVDAAKVAKDGPFVVSSG